MDVPKHPFFYDTDVMETMSLDPHIKAVGFDMDGTLMDTHVDYVKLQGIVADEFLRLGVPAEIIRSDTYKFSIELGKNWLRENGMSDKLPAIDRHLGDRATVVEMENADIAKPFPGAMDLLERLRSMGYKVGVLTRGGREYATRILDASSVSGKLDALVARDDYPEEEAKPNPLAMEHFAEKIGTTCEEILYLGDGWVDYLTAKRAGSQFIGVETGGRRKPDWDAFAGENVDVIRSVADLDRRL